ncbi:protein of unknown function [Catalinimonas alkaloidigena]|uniref:DUF4832 domain-containing protein n=1 Tax=Catalinimonas alkaloidigena TaxID=1075417 RepID=A0A1G9J016_9BACT|nr:DUF4832 domain-containing protein [Catalinimonas alkaloidigena]SDL30819.1 protein of unknown function [Catalinimonas alkaloidigena]
MHKLVLSVALFGMVACAKNPATDPTPQLITTTYTESDEDFPNPERGFYRYSETHVDAYTPLDATELASYRQPQTVSGARYSVPSTLVFRYYVLDGYTDQPLPAEFLSRMETDFAAVRQAGVKLIPRFAYTVAARAGNCPEGFACPPYGDAPKEVVLNHIAQLKPVLRANSDVIACLQMGFIGIWGENYYTDYFGDPSTNATQGKFLDENWQDRTEVLQALLDALPDDRMVQVRTPQMKQRAVYGVNAPVSAAALQESEAFEATDKARIGFHNDCFQASATDYGTFEDYGNSSTPRKDANTALRNYAKMDSRYTVVGGETCSDAYSPQNDCAPAGQAEEAFREMHYSYLNAAYNVDVNNDWVDGGCMASIQRKLGYRLVLREATLPDRVAKGDTLAVSLALENLGYASPYNPRPVQLVLRQDATQQQFSFPFATDIRRWFTGSVSLDASFIVPDTLPAGDYEMFLQLPDAATDLATRPEYSIRLANENVWEAATGYNALQHTLTVTE